MHLPSFQLLMRHMSSTSAPKNDTVNNVQLAQVRPSLAPSPVRSDDPQAARRAGA